MLGITWYIKANKQKKKKSQPISLYFLAVLGSLGQDKPGIMALVQKFLDVLKAKQVKGKVNCQLLDEYFSNVLFRCGNLSAYSS